ncbi:MAG: hypothetical protein DME97_07280 [Verrucomicrobia bacterium]|nr:MAG: hypothetical protein DME97_07280 [Verrucomicrobiota bacterium]
MVVLNPFKFPRENRFADYEGIPQLSAEDILINYGLGKEYLAVDLEVPLVPLGGHMTHTEMVLVVGLIKVSNASSFLEIGTFDGLTALNILRNCAAVREIVTVDLPDEIHRAGGSGTRHPLDQINASMLDTVAVGSRLSSHPQAGKVRQIRKDSASLDEADLTRSTYDCFLIDGSHTFQYCYSDTQFALRHLAKQGFILWHDYSKLKTLSGVTRCLLTLAESGEYSLFWLRSGDIVTSLVIGFRRADFSEGLAMS